MAKTALIFPQPPFSEREIREMRLKGDTVSTIAHRLYIRQRMSKDEVRRILFGG